MSHPRWEERPDGSRVRFSNGIRIVNHNPRRDPRHVEHFVTWQDELGQMVILGLDGACRPVYVTTLEASG